MTTEQVTRIVTHYGYKPLQIHAVQKGYRNESYAFDASNGKTLNLIVYKTESGILKRIKNAHFVAEHLAKHGVTVRVPVDERITQVRSGSVTKYACVYTYLPGTTIPWEAYTMDHIKQLGAHLSKMHAALRDLPQEGLPQVTNELLALDERMRNYFGGQDVARAMQDKLGLRIRSKNYETLLRLLSDQPGQALHMDFVRGNILFQPGTAEITGVLDFEKAAWGLPIFDVARTLAFLLVDCKHKTPEQVCKYFLHSGYNKRGANHIRPTRVLDELVNFFLLHDFYKFLRHNPYESLAENEHYVRTRDILLTRNIISKEK